MKNLSAKLHAAFHEPDTHLYRVVQTTVWGLILLSILLLVLEALVPEAGRAARVIPVFDRIILGIFAAEILLRIGTYRPASARIFRRPPMRHLQAHIWARIRFTLQPMMLIDILAVLALFPELRGFRALRLLRLLRTVRVFRYRNPFAIVLQALEENALLFNFAFSVLGGATLVGGLSMYLVEVHKNPTINSAFDGIWWALVTITTVGFGDITPVTPLGRIVGGVVMVSGMFTLALFAGIVGSSLVSGMLSIREEQFRMSDYVNHVVACGYDESTPLLLQALHSELDLNAVTVVVYDDHERPRDLPPEFLWVEGDQTKESELDKVRLTHAAAVILSGARDMTPQAADARTILTAFTIRSFLKKHRGVVRNRKTPLYVIAEILDAENVGHARAAGADEVIETRKIGYSMIAHAVTHHGTASTMSRVLLGGMQNVYMGKIPNPPRKPISFGELAADPHLAERGGLAIGVRTPSGKDIINPNKEYPVDPESLLIYLAKEPVLSTVEADSGTLG